MNKSTNRPSKIPIAVTRVRKGGAVGKLQSNIKRDDRQLRKSKEALTLHSTRTVKKIPNFKKLHKQFEAHVARGKVKKKPVTVFVEFPLKGNKENVLMKSKHNDKKAYKRDEVTVTSIPSVAMVKKVNEEHCDVDFMLKFKELCKQYESSWYQRPRARVSKQHSNAEKLVQLHNNADFKSLVEKAAWSQHHKSTVRHRPVVSPAYRRGMQEASEAMLRSVKHLHEPRRRCDQLDDLRTNLANQLDCCSDKVADMQHGNSRRRNTMIL